MRLKPNSETIQLAAALVCIVASGLVPDMIGSGYWSYSFQLVNILIAAAVAQNFLLQDANQVSFGQGAIFGAGAYIAAMAMSLYGLPWIAAAGCAILGSALAGLVYAIPALRVQGYYLGFVTLSVAMVFPDLLFTLDSFTNGINGISIAADAWKAPVFLGITPLSLAAAGLAGLAVTAHVLLRRAPIGRKVRVAGASPEAAQTLGIRPGVVRCAVFAATAAFTGAAGSLYPPIVGFVSPAAFQLELSILLFLAVIVGGRGQIFGPFAGIYLLHLLPNVLLVQLTDYRLLAYGIVALVVMLLLPDGLIGSLHRRFRARSAAESLFLSSDNLPLPPANEAMRNAQAKPAISLRGASKSFGAVRALDGIDLDIVPGRIVGLVGANGSGKTSLINAVTGFSKLSSGSISINGRSIERKSPSDVARMGVGRTFQNPRIFDALTAWENINIGVENAQNSIAHAARDGLQRLRGKLAAIGTERIPHGQRRTIEVMRVVLRGADIILLDEPAAGLSQEEREQLRTLLKRLQRECGKTILLVEHDLDLVWKVADEIVVMEGGRVVAKGSPDTVAADPSVRHLFVEPIRA